MIFLGADDSNSDWQRERPQQLLNLVDFGDIFLRRIVSHGNSIELPGCIEIDEQDLKSFDSKIVIYH